MQCIRVQKPAHTLTHSQAAHKVHGRHAATCLCLFTTLYAERSTYEIHRRAKPPQARLMQPTYRQNTHQSTITSNTHPAEPPMPSLSLPTLQPLSCKHGMKDWRRPLGAPRTNEPKPLRRIYTSTHKVNVFIAPAHRQ